MSSRYTAVNDGPRAPKCTVPRPNGRAFADKICRQCRIAAEPYNGLRYSIYGAGFGQQKVFFVCSQLSHYFEIAANHRPPRGHAFQNFQRTASLHHVTVVPQQR
jgi:hypothetical protein